MSYSIKLKEVLVRVVRCLSINSGLGSWSVPAGEQVPVAPGEAEEPRAIPSAAASYLPSSPGVQGHVFHPLALELWVPAKCVGEADTSLKHTVKSGAMCGLESFCLQT